MKRLCGARCRIGAQSIEIATKQGTLDKLLRRNLCKRPPVPGRTRCRLHGGLSTGPRTPEGKKVVGENRARLNRQLHTGNPHKRNGKWTKSAKAQRKAITMRVLSAVEKRNGQGKGHIFSEIRRRAMKGLSPSEGQ
jgi:hypothetical protein